MKIRRILVIVVPIIIALIVAAYIYLGGFKDPEFLFKESTGYIIFGKRYTGKLEDKNLKASYKEVQEKYEDGKLKGTFAVMHIHEPDQKEGKVDAVIGVIVEDSLNAQNNEYKYYTWRKGPVAEVTIKSHFAVSPSPQEVIEYVAAQAKSRGYKIGKGSFEKYFDTDHLVVEIPLEKDE
jgi:hypothetical protein